MTLEELEEAIKRDLEPWLDLVLPLDASGSDLQQINSARILYRNMKFSILKRIVINSPTL